MRYSRIAKIWWYGRSKRLNNNASQADVKVLKREYSTKKFQTDINEGYILQNV